MGERLNPITGSDRLARVARMARRGRVRARPSAAASDTLPEPELREPGIHAHKLSRLRALAAAISDVRDTFRQATTQSGQIRLIAGRETQPIRIQLKNGDTSVLWPRGWWSDFVGGTEARQKFVTAARRRIDPKAIEIDCFHGEPRGLEPQALAALLPTIQRNAEDRTNLVDDGGKEFDKEQPIELRTRVVDRLVPNLHRAGVPVKADDVLVCHSSTLEMLEAVTLALWKPGGVVLGGDGNAYKSGDPHMEKMLGVRTGTFPMGEGGKPDAKKLRAALEAYGDSVMFVSFVQPGNPIPFELTKEEVNEIAEVLLEFKLKHGVVAVFDSVFEIIQERYNAIAAGRARVNGKEELLYNHCIVLTGPSKSFGMTPDGRFGALLTGDPSLRKRVARVLRVYIQREITANAVAVMDATTQSMIDARREEMSGALRRAKERIAQINDALRTDEHPADVFQIEHDPKDGPFMMLRIVDSAKARIYDSSQAWDFWHALGLRTADGLRTRKEDILVRLNVHQPRVDLRPNPDALWTFLFEVGARLRDGLTYDQVLWDLEIGEKKTDSPEETNEMRVTNHILVAAGRGEAVPGNWNHLEEAAA